MGDKDFKKYAELVTRARQGDGQAFQKIYEETYKAQIFHLKSFINEPEELQDALQEVYILLYQNLHKINPPRLLIAYLNRLSYFVGKNIARKQYHREIHTTDSECLELLEEPQAQELLCNLENQEKQKILRNTIQKLPKMERSVIFMRYFQNLKHQEVALSLGITQAGSKFLQRSAHTHMRELLKKEGISSWGILIPFFLRCPALRLPGQKSPENTKFTAAAGHTGISSIAAAAGMFAAVVCTGSLAGAPVINSIELPSGLTKAPARVEVRVRTPFPVSEIRMDNGSALPVFGKRTSPDSYAVYVRENGDYTVKIKTNNGKSTSETVKINCIDSGRPEASCTLENGKLYASVWDDESGIDFASLYCDTEDRSTIYPEHIDRQAGLAVFPLPGEDVTLRLRDNAGNKSKMLITYAH